MSIHLTPAQAVALASLSGREGPLVLHQVNPSDESAPGDVYATPDGSTTGFRIAVDGETIGIGETLPAAG